MSTLLKKKKLACIGANLAFSEEDEIAILGADIRFLLVESFHLGDSLNCNQVVEGRKSAVAGNFYRKAGPVSAFSIQNEGFIAIA